MNIKPFPERFWDKVQKTDGCWLWMGSRKEAGYGHLNLNNKTVLAHRTAYELVKGPIPTGLNCCHTCDNPSCVNPDHIFLGTQRENMRDCFNKKRHPLQLFTHCKRGHLFTPENSMPQKPAGKTCRICYNASHRRAYKKKRDRINAHLEAETKKARR